jgi:hypothetical protein
MQITSNQLDLVKEQLQARMLQRDCPCCGENDWDVNEIVVLHTDDLCNEIVGQLPSMVQVICRECANVLLFDLNRVKNFRRQEVAMSISSPWPLPHE